MPYENTNVEISAFTPTNYDITYNLNGGTLPEGYPATYTIQSDDVILPTPTKENSRFLGWFDNSGLTGSPVTTIPHGSTGAKTFWASWETIVNPANKDFGRCAVTLDNQELKAYDKKYEYYRTYTKISYKFGEANNSPCSDYNISVGEIVKDGETKLTLGTDYYFGSVTYQDPNRTPNYQSNSYDDKPGDECVVEIIGMGDYDGTLYADFTIIGPEVSNQTWGDLTWSLSNGELSISLTNPANGNKPMPETNREGYPWYPFGSYITSISINKDNETGYGITTVAAYAFASTSNVSTYGNVTSVSLPSTLTSIGDYAFDHCSGAAITIPTNTTTFGSAPFNQVGYEDNGVIKGGVTATLSDTGNNSALISALSSAKYANVTINRTLYKDGAWNTLCLPFDMTNAQVTAQLAPYALKEVDVDNYYDANNIPYEKRDDGKYYDGSTEYTGDVNALHQTGLDGTTLNLYFKDATSIEAGKPYIIKWNKPNDYVAYNGKNAETCSDITSLTFNGVKIDADASTEVSFTGGKFKGTYAPIVWDNTNTSILFLGVKDNKSALYYPQPDLTDPQNPKYPRVNAFRAYFQLNNGQQASAFNLNFDENETTEIRTTNYTNYTNFTNSDEWFDMQGRKLEQQPTKKGIYINNGHKVVIK